LKKNDYFCEFEPVIAQLEFTKTKLPSDYKILFQNPEKQIEKV
jgi:hypothetical protein